MQRRWARSATRLGGCWLFWTAMLALGVAHAAPGEAFRVEHLLQIDRVAEAQIAPDGSQIALVTERKKGDTYFSTHQTLWLVPTRGGAPTRVDAGDPDASAGRPLWAPGGERLLHRRSVRGTSELAILDLGSGSSHIIRPCDEGETAGTVAWSPDGRRIAAICNGSARRADGTAEGTAAAGKQTQAKPLSDKVIVATRSSLYDDSVARPLTPERRVVLASVDGPERTEAFRDAHLLDHNGVLQWEGADVLWVTGAAPNPYGGVSFAPGRVLHRYDLKSKAHQTLPAQAATEIAPVLTGSGGSFVVPTGGTIVSAGPEAFRDTWKLVPLELQLMRGGQLVPSPVAAQEIFTGRRFVWIPGRPARPEDGTLYFMWLDRGAYRVRALQPSHEARWRDLTPSGTNVANFSITPDGSAMALVLGDANTPNDLYVLDLTDADAEPRRLTRFGDAVRDLFTVSQVEPVSWRSADDRFDVHGWLVKPADYRPGKRYPLLLDVHGGPGVAFLNSFDTLHFEGGHQVPPELFASRGYAVLMVNPRGDPGYGREYQEALREGWEYPTRYDLIEGVREMVRRGIADPERLGIAGASYGGWVAAFAITQTDLFKAASANDPVIDTRILSAAAYRGNLPGNYWMDAGFAGGHILDVPFPTADPRQVKAPILLRFGLMDEAPMPSQFFVSGLEYFTYLHVQCKPVEMILHPDEGHGVFDGETWRDYVERDLAWFDYWLLGKGELPYKPHACSR